jgi:hypothetical protein
MSRWLRVVSRCASGYGLTTGLPCDHPLAKLASGEIGGRGTDHGITVG